MTLHFTEEEVDDLEFKVALEALIEGALTLCETFIDAHDHGDVVVERRCLELQRDALRSIRRLQRLMKAQHA